MRHSQLPNGIILSDAQVRDVIARAVRVVPEQTGITVAQLREMAAELDIDPRALEAALDQVIGLPIPGRPIRSWLKRQIATLGRFTDSFLPRSGRLIGSALFGGLAGWLNAFLMVFTLNGHFPIAAAMVGLTVANLLSRRLDRDLPRFLGETLATWGAYAALWSLTAGQVTQNLVVWVALWTALASGFGIVLLRDTSRRGGMPPLLPEATQPRTQKAPDESNELRRGRHAREWLLRASGRPARA